jgi:membrane protease YdiL (CAAX protease family)
LFAVPLGRLADRLGTRFGWIAGAVLQALLFGAWVLVGNFAAYVAVEVLLALGWAIIAGIIVIAAIGVHPSARAAERYLARRAEPVPAPA